MFDLGAPVVRVETRWHYTPADTWPEIRAAGAIVPQAESSDPRLVAVWFSTDPFIEPSAAGLVRRQEMSSAAGQIVRIGVRDDYPLTPWTRARYKLDPLEWCGLEWSAIILGSDPRRWLVTDAPVALVDCPRIERWDGREWTPIEPHEREAPTLRKESALRAGGAMGARGRARGAAPARGNLRAASPGVKAPVARGRAAKCSKMAR